MNIDWEAYYKEFVAVHGQPIPVRSKDGDKVGWLLFPDGYRYGLKPEGPEMPPENEKRRLAYVRLYWTKRKQIITEELNTLLQDIRKLAELQANLSAPLMLSEARMAEDDDGKLRPVLVSSEVDWDLLFEKAQDLKQDLIECSRSLESYKDMEPPEKPFLVNLAAVIANIEEIQDGL